MQGQYTFCLVPKDLAVKMLFIHEHKLSYKL